MSTLNKQNSTDDTITSIMSLLNAAEDTSVGSKSNFDILKNMYHKIIDKLLALVGKKDKEIESLKAKLSEANTRNDFLQSENETLQRQVEEYERKANYDSLTGLYSQGLLDEIVNSDNKKINPEYNTIIFCDLNYFKLINDTVGHKNGNVVLQKVGAVIKSTIGEYDLAFRNGGDEFVIILKGRNMQEALDFTKRLSNEVSRLGQRLQKEFNMDIGVTVSCGVSPIDSKKPLCESLHYADQAMYAVKNDPELKNNCGVVFYNPQDGSYKSYPEYVTIDLCQCGKKEDVHCN